VNKVGGWDLSSHAGPRAPARGGTAAVDANSSPVFVEEPLPSYSYDSGRNRGLEKVVWIVMLVMVSFVLLSTFQPAFKAYIKSTHGGFALGLVVIYLMFLVFSRRIFRQQRLAGVKIATTRRNFTFTDMNGEKVHSWRDVKDAVMRVEVDGRGQAYLHRLTLNVPKAKVVLENDPGAPLSDAAGLLAEVRERVPVRKWRFHWYHPVCPLCSSRLEGPRCPGCGEEVTYVSKIARPWEIVREETLYLFLLLVVAGMTAPLFYLLALVFIVGVFAFKLLANGVARLRPMPGAGAALALALLLLLGLRPAAAGPRSNLWPWPSSSRPMADVVYLPLAIGNTWEYRSNFETVVMKVSGQENVNGTPCYVMESYVGDGTEPVQKEYLAVGARGIQVWRRLHKGSDYFLESAETILPFPFRAGVHWTWQAPAAQGGTLLAFEVMGERHISVLGRDMVATLLLIHGRSTDGSEMQTKRWYCRGVGMVREQTMMKKAGKATTIEAVLQNYSLRMGPRSSE
jgi:hypothetical protein